MSLIRHYVDTHGINLNKDGIFQDYLVEIQRRVVSNNNQKIVGNGFCVLCNKYVTKIAMHVFNDHWKDLSMSKQNRELQYGGGAAGVSNERSGFFDRFKIGINDKKNYYGYDWKDRDLVKVFLLEKVEIHLSIRLHYHLYNLLYCGINMSMN